MITRKQYLDNPELHHEYYLGIARAAKLTIPAALVVQSKIALSNGDKHLNTILMMKWDAFYELNRRNPHYVKTLKERGEVSSLAVSCCTMKALAREKSK